MSSSLENLQKTVYSEELTFCRNKRERNEVKVGMETFGLQQGSSNYGNSVQLPTHLPPSVLSMSSPKLLKLHSLQIIFVIFCKIYKIYHVYKMPLTEIVIHCLELYLYKQLNTNV